MKLELGSILLATVLGGCATAPVCPEPPAPLVATSEAPATSSTSAEVPEAEPAGAATVVILVRHAEKAADGSGDPPLTERGQRRAECLATLLRPFAPDHLLTSQYQRTRATLEPLARATGLTPRVIDASDDEAWARALHQLPPGSRAVVSGHSNTLPIWVAALGVELGGLDAEGNIPHDDYDRMIQVVIDVRGRTVTSFTTAYCVEPEPALAGR